MIKLSGVGGRAETLSEKQTKRNSVPPLDFNKTMVKLSEQTRRKTMKTFVSGRCIVCSDELTDPVSLQYSIGPICRKKSNRLLATEMPSVIHTIKGQQLLNALAAAALVETDNEVVLRLREISEMFFKFQDLRETVVEAAALLNRVQQQTADILCALIEAAGYKTYLGYILNICASSEENYLSVNNGKVFFKCVRNRSGNNELRKIGSRWVHPDGWLIPTNSVEKVYDIIREFWPFSKDIEKQISAVKQQLTGSNQTIFVKPVEQKKVTSFLHFINVSGFDHVLFTAPKYNAEAIEEIKKIQGRRFHPAHKSVSGQAAWSVPVQEKASIEEIAKKFFDLQ
jgi:hypothetical protein